MVGIKGLGCAWATVEVKGWANDGRDVTLAGIWSGLVLEHSLNKIGCNSKGDPGTVTVATRDSLCRKGRPQKRWLHAYKLFHMIFVFLFLACFIWYDNLLRCFYVLAVVSSAVMNAEVHVCF